MGGACIARIQRSNCFIIKKVTLNKRSINRQKAKIILAIRKKFALFDNDSSEINLYLNVERPLLLTDGPQYIFLSQFFLRIFENIPGRTCFYKLSQIHEDYIIGQSLRLPQDMRHDYYGIILF